MPVIRCGHKASPYLLTIARNVPIEHRALLLGLVIDYTKIYARCIERGNATGDA